MKTLSAPYLRTLEACAVAAGIHRPPRLPPGPQPRRARAHCRVLLDRIVMHHMYIETSSEYSAETTSDISVFGGQ